MDSVHVHLASHQGRLSTPSVPFGPALPQHTSQDPRTDAIAPRTRASGRRHAHRECASATNGARRCRRGASPGVPWVRSGTNPGLKGKSERV
eukprot:scaffold944_cov333-Pavlova_lutheri.AAC.4